MRRTSAKALGLGSGTGAGLVWGLAFLIPEIVAAESVELTFARYAIYGLASMTLLAWRWPGVRKQLTGTAWRAALWFAVSGNVGYYLLLVLGIRLVGAPATVTVIGTIPVTVALAGNLRHREFPFRLLAAPIVLVATGLVLVNTTELAGGAARPDATTGEQLAGMACAFGALALWTSYGVGNASFLKQHPRIGAGDWATVTGVATGFLALPLLPLALTGGGLALGRPGSYVAAALTLGLVVSWGGTLLWNRASTALPTAIVGLLVVVETVAGITYVAAYRTYMPPPTQLLGIALVITGVLTAIRTQQRHVERRINQR